MDLLTDPQIWIALIALSTLEIVLGVDNLVFISIAVSRLAPQRRPAARKLGLAFACLTRIGLLLTLAHLARLNDTRSDLFMLFGQVISVRDVILILGGAFLVVKGIMEVADAIRSAGGNGDAPKLRATSAFWLVIAQIAIVDIVFSLDSVITAVGMVSDIAVMVAAIVLAVLVMMLAANPVGDFIDAHPTVRMLALAFIVLIGAVLIGDGFQLAIPRTYLYFAMGFAAAIEGLNLLAARNGPR